MSSLFSGGSQNRAVLRSAAKLEVVVEHVLRVTDGCAGSERKACQSQQSFRPGRGPVFEELAELDPAPGYPVELNDAAFANERLMAVKGIFTAPEREQGAFHRWHFDHHILDVVGRTQQPKAATRLLPFWVQVD